jgi:hypothetical protein
LGVFHSHTDGSVFFRGVANFLDDDAASGQLPNDPLLPTDFFSDIDRLIVRAPRGGLKVPYGESRPPVCREHGDLLREEIAQTVASPEKIKEELSYLMSAVSL